MPDSTKEGANAEGVSCSGSCAQVPTTNEILSDRSTSELGKHEAAHPITVRDELDRLKGRDDRAHDVILVLFWRLRLVENRAKFLGNALLEERQES